MDSILKWNYICIWIETFPDRQPTSISAVKNIKGFEEIGSGVVLNYEIRDPILFSQYWKPSCVNYNCVYKISYSYFIHIKHKLKPDTIHCVHELNENVFNRRVEIYDVIMSDINNGPNWQFT